MEITVNGETRKFEDAVLSLTDLLQKSEVKMPEMVSVQINGEFVDRAVYAQKQVHGGDSVDFLYFMGGGGR